MRRSIPRIKETSEQLEAMVRKQKNLKLKSRLRMLALLKGGKAQTRQQVADQLGVHRNTVGRWLESYQSSAIEGLLSIKSTAPKQGQHTIEHSAYEALKRRLEEPRGFSSYKEIQHWLYENWALSINYMTLHRIVRYRLGAKPKVARKSHIKKSRASQ